MPEASPLAGIFQSHQARALVDAGHRVGVVSTGLISPRKLIGKYPYQQRERDNGISIWRDFRQAWLKDSWRGQKKTLKVQLELGLRLVDDYIKQEGQPDVIHAHNTLCAGLVASAVQTRYQIPFVITEHSSQFIETTNSDANVSQVVAAALATAGVVTGVSSDFVEKIKRQSWSRGIDSEVFPNLLDPFFEAKKIEIKDGCVDHTFLSVGSLIPLKNYELTLSALRRPELARATLAIAGEGPDEGRLRTLVNDTGLTDRVQFLGRLNRDQLFDKMMEGGVLVHASRTETFGVVLIEALACGMPVVSTKCGGPMDIVNSSNGELVDFDAQLLAQTMVTTAPRFDSQRRIQIASDCRAKFGAAAFLARAERIYAKAIGT